MGSPERWKQLEKLLDRALDLPPGERAAFLDQACAGDAVLRAEVERLLGPATSSGSFLREPASAYAAPLVSRLEGPESLPPGTRLGAYEILRELGRGGMATVYLAADLRHARQVALKVLRADLSALLGGERFLHEIRVTANLQHPHILPLFDSGVADSRVFYVLPYVDGESLRARLRREKQLPVDHAVRIAREVASALDHAHRHGVIHRDIKPENILLQDGSALVADFGIALALREAGGSRLTETGISLGTPQYMSPEQATADRELDARSDVYSLGAVLYEMLAGEPPHTGPTVQAVVAKLLTETPMRLRVRRDRVPEALEQAVAQALAKLPADRFASAAEFARALAAEPIAAGPAAQPRRWIAAALGLVAVAIVTVALIVLPARRRGGEAPAPPATPIQATFTGNVQAAAISRDGSRLALATRECDDKGHCSVALSWQDLGGAGALRLTAGLPAVYRISWSPDGRYLLFTGTDTAGQFGAFRIAALGGRLEFLGCCLGEFVGTADSVLLTPSRAPGSPVVIQLVTAPDGRVRDSLVLVRPNVVARWSTPSPDGRWILVVLAHADQSSMLLVSDRRGRVVDSLAAGPMSWGTGPRFDPQGDRIVFREYDPAASYFSHRGHLMRVAFDQRSGRLSRPALLVDWHDGLTQFDVAGDAEGTVVYLVGPMETSINTMVRVGRGTRYVTRTLTRATGALNGLIAPDGHAVALLRPVPGGKRQLVVVPFDGGVESPVTPPDQLEDFAWLGNARVLYTVRGSGRDSRLLARELATGAVLELGVVPPASVLFWLRTAAVATPTAGDRELLVVSLDGSRRRLRLPDSTVKMTTLIAEPGGASVITVGYNTTDDTMILGRFRLADGRFTRLGAKVVEDWSGGVWLPSGRVELELDETLGSSTLYQIDPEGGPLTRVGMLPYSNAAYRFAMDGRRAVASVFEPRADVWILPSPSDSARRR
jgi:Tol biopolymer transport system component